MINKQLSFLSSIA